MLNAKAPALFKRPVRLLKGISTLGDLDNTPVSVTASVTLTAASHAGRLMVFSIASGATVTLPAAAGRGDMYRFFVNTTVTSNSDIIKVANATDIMAGLAIQSQDGGNTVQAWETAADSDTITLNGSTTGGIKGDFVELIDVASGLWFVRIVGSATGTEATPFSATVS